MNCPQVYAQQAVSDSNVPAWSDPARRNRNNFDFLRLLFSVAVIISHSFATLGKNEEPLARLSNGRYLFGGLAVNGFFIISGYLIAASFVRSPRFFDYLSRRIRRIYPGFIVAVGVTLFFGYVAGAYQMPAGEFLKEAGKALVSTMTLTPYQPPFAFSSNPISVFNASLWTIRPEFTCYLLLALVFQLRRTAHRMLMLLILPLISSALEISFTTSGQSFLTALRPYIPSIANPDWPLRLWFSFAIGAGMYLYGHRVPYRHSLAAVALVLMVFLQVTPFPRLSAFLAAVPFAYLVFWFAYNPFIRLRDFGHFGDFSYGIYLYGFPVQQILVLFLAPLLNPYTLILLSIAILFPIAAMSWFLVERPCLTSRRRQRIDLNYYKTELDRSKESVGAVSPLR
ncbi:MAG: acyltransferase 3 [Chthoniobacteraceae bacterium]|nr:acyltransferase 3 [Chthoniobacteraceae bacterium]